MVMAVVDRLDIGMNDWIMTDSEEEKRQEDCLLDDEKLEAFVETSKAKKYGEKDEE